MHLFFNSLFIFFNSLSIIFNSTSLIFNSIYLFFNSMSIIFNSTSLFFNSYVYIFQLCIYFSTRFYFFLGFNIELIFLGGVKHRVEIWKHRVETVYYKMAIFRNEKYKSNSNSSFLTLEITNLI